MASAAPSLQREYRIVGIVSAAHGGSHYFHLVLPPLFPALKAAFGAATRSWASCSAPCS